MFFFIVLAPGPGTINVFEHVSVLNSQSVLRNYVTLYDPASTLCLRFVLSRIFLYSLGPWA